MGFMRKSYCVLALALVAVVSCSIDEILSKASSVSGALSGSGTNVFASGSPSSLVLNAEVAIDSVISSYEGDSERIAEAVKKIEEIITDDETGTYDIDEVKGLIKDLTGSVSVADEQYETLMLEISKASVNESARKALRETISQKPVSKDSAAYKAYDTVMKNMASLLKAMNQGRESSSQYALRLDSNSGEVIDFKEIFESIAEPTVADLVVMKTIFKTSDSILDMVSMDGIKMEESSDLIGSVLDLSAVVEVLGTSDEGEYNGFVGFVQLIVDKLAVKGVLDM